MMKKDILRKAWMLLAYAILVYDTVEFILGKADTMAIIYICTGYGALTLMAIIKIISKITIVMYQYQLYKLYKNEIKYLQMIHQIRYKLYFTGTREQVKEYSKELEVYGTQFIKAGDEAISQNLLNKKQSEHLREMLSQARTLMTTEQSNARGT